MRSTIAIIFFVGVAFPVLISTNELFNAVFPTEIVLSDCLPIISSKLPLPQTNDAV